MVKYNRLTEVVASCLMVVSFSFLLAGNLVAGGYMFEAFLGTNYTAGVMLLAIIVFIYTASGGLFAVAYTDAIQVGIAFVGSLGLIAFIVFRFGLNIATDTGPIAFEQLSDPAAGAVINWATLLALGFGNLAAIDFMARIFAADSPETARKSCLIASAGTLIIGIPFSLVALSAPQILESVGVTPEGPLLFALLGSVAPPILALLVIVAILSASLSTADGAILGTSSVVAHNLFGIRHDDHRATGDRLLLITRVMAFIITVMGVFFALRVPQTGILLLLAFDLSFAGLVVPLAGGLYYPRATWQGALACIIFGSFTRLIFFVLMPTTFGIENTLLYIPNNIFSVDFDGFPTLISPLVGLVAFIIVSNLTGGRKATPQRVRIGQTEAQLYRR